MNSGVLTDLAEELIRVRRGALAAAASRRGSGAKGKKHAAVASVCGRYANKLALCWNNVILGIHACMEEHRSSVLGML